MKHPDTQNALYEKKLLACVHCGFCLSACPTYTRLGDEGDSPRGRIYLMRAVYEGRLEADDPAVEKHIDQCLGCRACEPVCPAGVEYGWLLERTRDRIRQEAGSSFMARALLFAYGNKTMASIVSFFARALRVTGLPKLVARITPDTLGKLKFSMAMLAATSPNAHSYRTDRISRISRTPRTNRPERIAILSGCVQDGLYKRVNNATEYVLEKNGFERVEASAQECCGALHAHSGELEASRALARRNIVAFEQSGADHILVNAAGCGAHMKQYDELLEHDPEWHTRASAFSARVRDLSEFLAATELTPGGRLEARVTYDAPCHLIHAQRITDAPLDLMARIPGLELVPLPRMDECCGGAGIYGLLHQDLGGRILKDKVDAVVSTGAQVVATPNPGCMMQIGAGLVIHGCAVDVVHPIELLAESYRIVE